MEGGVCPNCGQSLTPDVKYCPNCGQKTTDGKISVARVTKEFFVEQLNLDGKLWNSLRASVIPGKLTVEYFEGKRKSHLNPFRWYLIVAVIPLILLQIYGSFDSTQLSLDSQSLDRLVWYGHKADAFAVIDSLEHRLKERMPDSSATVLRDSLILDLKKDLDLRADSVDLNEGFKIGIEKGSFLVSVRDFNSMDSDSLLSKYQINDLWQRMVLRQKIKLFKEPSSLIKFFVGNTAWMLLLFMPIVALILSLLYIRQKRFYIEHLVFSLHQHTILIIILTTLGITGMSTGWDSWLWTALLAFVLYLFMAMKRYYNQGWIKTIVKFLIVNTLYPIMFTFFIILASLSSILLF